jgi:uncharacterized protein YdeI (YjbR/CyaY-like superfamily)
VGRLFGPVYRARHQPQSEALCQDADEQVVDHIASVGKAQKGLADCPSGNIDSDEEARRKPDQAHFISEGLQMNRMNPKVDVFLSKAKKWRAELEKLRTIILDCDLTEELKWGAPCYTFQKNNVVLMRGFKEYCALLFFKGALLSDAHGILVKPGEHTQAGRQIRFTSAQEVIEMEPILKAYIYEAIEVEKAGLKVDFEEKTELVFPEEFQKKLDEDPALKAAFDALTPGRQRAYNLYFAAPKQSKTRESRVERYVQRILDGKGLHDR